MIIDKEDFEYLKTSDLMIDGYFGGFVIGMSHEVGGIPIVSYAKEDEYEIMAEMEGFEFLMNVAASSIYQRRIQEINSELDQIEANSSIEVLWSNLGKKHPNLKVLSAIVENQESLFKTKFILIHGPQFIVNKYSSLYYYDELYEMNHSCKSLLAKFIGY